MTEAAPIPDSVERELTPPAYAVVLLHWLVRRHWRLILGSALAVGLFSALGAVLQVPVYRATAEILIDLRGLQVIGRDIERTGPDLSLDLADVDSQAFVLTSTPVLARVVRELNLGEDPDYRVSIDWLSREWRTPSLRDRQERDADAVEILRKDIVVNRVEGSLVFQVTASARTAATAAGVANAVTTSYIEQARQRRTDAERTASRSLLDQIAPLRFQLDAADEAVERFRTGNGLIRSSDTGLVVTQQLQELTSQLDTAEAEAARLSAEREQVLKMSPDELLSDTLPEYLVSPVVTSLRSQFAQTAREGASLGQTLAPQHPRMVELRADLAESRNLLESELARIRTSVVDAAGRARANVVKLQALAKTITQSATTSGSAEVKLHQLESEAAAIRTVFNASLSRSKEIEQQRLIDPQNSKVLSEAAAPAKRSNPSLPVAAAVGALLGALLGFGWGYMAEVLPLRRMRREWQRAVPLSAEAAGLLLGADVIARVATRKGSGKPAKFIDLARGLQEKLGTRLPVVVAIEALPQDDRVREIREELGSALAELGEDVLICDAEAEPMQVRRLPSRSALIGREFILVTRDRNSLPTTVADAVVLAVDLSRAGASQISQVAANLCRPSQSVLALALLDAAPNAGDRGRSCPQPAAAGHLPMRGMAAFAQGSHP